MKNKKIRTVKKASFYSMLKYSILFVFINFIVISIFTVILASFLIENNEENMANVLIEDIVIKNQNVRNISDDIVDIELTKYIDEKYKQDFINKTIKDQKDVLGVLILNEEGIIEKASTNYEEFIGYDFSRREYYKKVMKIKETVMSTPCVSHDTKEISMCVVSPIKNGQDVKGVVVTIIDPAIIRNNNIDGLKYYIANIDGDIIFNSGYEELEYQDNILGSKLMSNIKKGINKSIIYKDKYSGKYLLRNMKFNEKINMYVIIEHELFNQVLIDVLAITLFLILLFVSLFIFLFSTKFSKIATDYLSLFSNELNKISNGRYDIDLTTKYPYVEINNIIEKFKEMSYKVNQREQELQVYNEELRVANDDIRDMLVTINKNEKDKKEQYINIIGTMLNLIEIKDKYTAGHSRDVTKYSEMIAKKLNEDFGFNIDVEKVRVGAILHDIGKISIETKILNKPSRLTDEEFKAIKTHPEKGYYALKEIDNFKDVRGMVRYHHEKYNGMGYPKGIKGDIIPLGARIICVADAFDAMTSNRAYRKALPIDAAVEELIKNKGIQFDPLIVDVFLEILKQQHTNQEIFKKV